MKETIRFLGELKRNNNREWFATRREAYEHALRVRSSLVTRLTAAVAEVEPAAASLSEADCTYRIYRDTRFSPDKTPYKTHIGIFINPPYGKKSPLGGYYFHFEPGKFFFAAGNVCHPTKVLAAIRRSIVDNVEEYDDLMRDADFRSIFPNIGDNLLLTAPKGVARDWPYVEYVRPRDFVVSTAEEKKLPAWALTDDEALHAMLVQGYRFNRFINYAVAEALGIDL